MSFIEGDLSIATGDEKFAKKWCKVDARSFVWSAAESSPPLGKVELVAGGTIVVNRAKLRFDLFIGKNVLQVQNRHVVCLACAQRLVLRRVAAVATARNGSAWRNCERASERRHHRHRCSLRSARVT